MSSIAILPLILVGLVVLLLFSAGVIVLQIYLSSKDSKWMGLILPIISFLFSLNSVVRMVLKDRLFFDGFFRMGHELLLGNIPTIILVGIYVSFRKEIDRQSRLDKMNI